MVRSIKTPYGVLWGPDDEMVAGRILDANGAYQDKVAEVQFLREHVSPGALCIDVGANCGMTAQILQHLAGVDGLVFAYEPTPDLQPALRRTLRDGFMRGGAYGFAFDYAVGADLGVAWLVKNPLGSGGNRVQHTPWDGSVIQTTLDEHIHAHERPVGFLKIDAEGMDIDVLRGAVDILDRDRPTVMLEFNEGAMEALGKNPTKEHITMQGLCAKYCYSWREIDSHNIGLVPR